MSTLPIPAVAPQLRLSRARVPLDLPKGLFGRLLAWYSRRTYNAVLEPGLAMAHNRRVLMAHVGLERKVARYRALGDHLTTLATMAAAAKIECSWCLDYGYYEGHHRGIDPAKLRDVTCWRGSTVYTESERRVLEYAEAMTATPVLVTDELAGALRTDLGLPAFVELTHLVSLENLRSRFNSAMGLASQGFSETCRVPTR